MTQDKKIHIKREGNIYTIEFDMWSWCNEDKYWLVNDWDPCPFIMAAEQVDEHLLHLVDTFNKQYRLTIQAGNEQQELYVDDVLTFEADSTVTNSYYQASKGQLDIYPTMDCFGSEFIMDQWCEDFVKWFEAQEENLDHVAGEYLGEYMLEWPSREYMDQDEIDNIFDRMWDNGDVYDFDEGCVPQQEATEHQIWRHKNRVMSEEEDCELAQFVLNKEKVDVK